VPFTFRVIFNYTNGGMMLPAMCLMEPSSLGSDSNIKKQVTRRKNKERWFH
jgi:hypothetical protein